MLPALLKTPSLDLSESRVRRPSEHRRSQKLCVVVLLRALGQSRGKGGRYRALRKAFERLHYSWATAKYKLHAAAMCNDGICTCASTLEAPDVGCARNNKRSHVDADETTAIKNHTANYGV